MATLANFPMVSQLSGITSNGLPSLNAQFDCVPSSIGAAILWYQGKSQWDSKLNPNSIKDAVYGQGYTGGTSAEDYIPFCKSLGYNLSPINGTPDELIAEAHKQIVSGHPVIFTRDDPYSSNPNYTHVCVFYDEGTGWLAALDPYIAQRVIMSNNQWRDKLRFNQIWILTPIKPLANNTANGDLPMLELTDAMGQHFSETAPGRWHCKETNVDLAFANLTFYRMYGGIFRLPRTPEIYLKQYPGTALQVCEGAIIAYDPTDVFKQKPVGSGPVYLLKITEDIGQQLIARSLVSELQTQITDLTNQITQLKAEATNKPDVSGLQAQLQSYQAAFNQLEALVSQMKGKVY